MQYLHTMLRISSIEESLDFFCNKLGLQEIRRSDSTSGRFTLIFLVAEKDSNHSEHQKSPLLELTYNWDAEKYHNGRNFGHLAFSVDNIYTYCQHLITVGVEINRPPRDGRMAFIKSPDGISIELLQQGDALPKAEPWVSMPNIGTW